MNPVFKLSKHTVNMISVFILLFFSSSFYFSSNNGTFAIGMLLLFGGLAFLVNVKEMNLTGLLYLIVMVTLVIITSLLVGDTIKVTGIMIAGITIAGLFALGFSHDKFVQVYTNIMPFLALFSVIAFTISLFLPSLIQIFPTITNSAGAEAHFLGFSFVRLDVSQPRNMGMFWEPGAFQTYLNIGFLLEVFGRSTIRKNVIVIYTIALITTLSTAGFITLGLNLILLLLKTNERKQFAYFRISMLLLILVTVIVSIYPLLPANIQYAVFGKVLLYASGNYGIITTQVRLDSIIYPLQSFLSSPIIGVGVKGLGEYSSLTGHTMNTCTPLNWFARYGFIFGAICIMGIYTISKVLGKIPLVTFLIMLTMLVSISTESYVANGSILVFVLLGLFAKRPKKKQMRTNYLGIPKHTEAIT